MRTLIIHDNQGFVLSVRAGEPAPREPQGVPFLWVEVPDGKKMKSVGEIGVDVSITPHQAILEDIPPSEIEQLRLEMAQSNTELFEMMLTMNGGNA